MKSVTVHPLDDGRALGQLLERTATRDVVDAHLVMVTARLDDSIVTGDPDDLGRIAEATGAARPTVHLWLLPGTRSQPGAPERRRRDVRDRG